MYIEGSRDPDDTALRRVAAGIADRYGLPADATAARLAAGRYRIKSSIDRDTAEQLAEELASLGAVCTVVEDAGDGEGAHLAAASHEPAAVAQVTGLAHDGRRYLARSPRLRFAAGVLAALLIGFVPAHIFASVRESRVYQEIDAELRNEQAQVRDLEAWNALDELRAGLLARKQARRTSIALSSLVLWALGSSGVAVLWFRTIRWERYATEPGPDAPAP